jgi:hypothetical protein
MYNYNFNMGGMQEMVSFMSLEYLHVLWAQSFGKQKTGEVKSESRKAAVQMDTVTQLECCSTSHAH